jgi:hypothetical protein
MTEQLQLRRGTASQVAAFTGAQGELVVDTTNNRAVINDGATAGGWPAAKLAEVVTNTRVAVSDAAHSVLTTDRLIAYSALTAARAVTLCAASAYPTGTRLTIVDESGACSAANAITVQRAGSDTIGGATSAMLSSAYGYLSLESDGVGKWTIVDQAMSNLGAVGVGTAADPNNPLSIYGASALFNGVSFSFTINKAAAADTASIIFEDGFSGRAQIGLCGDDNFRFKVSSNGSTWLDALDINASTGQASFPFGVAAGEAVGFRSRLRNASFAINQRGVSGTVSLNAGQYGHDGAKGGASGCTYTFATSSLDTTLTITAGSLILPIEAALIEGGSYTVSNAGTAQARVWQGAGYAGSGSYAGAPAAPTTSPLTVTGLTAATQTNVEFSTGTVLRPQFEPGSAATAFERRPTAIELALCQRYARPWGAGAFGQTSGSAVIFLASPLSPPMRAAPTAVLGGFAGAVTGVNQYGQVAATASAMSTTVSLANAFLGQFTVTGGVVNAIAAEVGGDLAFLSAEL